ncbi:conserved hypothetical protein [Hyella patelloides LEGE 07179]|uniref:DUF2267 domain-containing protein n=1 Tax=Hyella patelloides LEGE 07179 TaxID=945734 RepID=A0A563VQY8_9CYAN|nr:DUF2267 domain-containing protein [Hyella patelloides]VEP13821.1 conserved hypothetical protein [Hyella patelloides LEGE 07179]
MTIALKDDVMYILLKKIHETDGNGKHSVDFQATDFTGRKLTIADFLGHLDYLNQKHYIDADFSGNAYANQEDVPDLINEEELDFRIANTLGAPDGPLPHLIKFKKAELTEKGKKMLERMEQNPPAALREGKSTPVINSYTPFLEKVALKAELPDIFDARDLTTVVYRTMRDLMTTEVSKAVESELQVEAEKYAENKRLQQEIADLWHDDNPLVAWLSNIRPPLKFDADTFIFRIEKEGGLPRGTTGKKVINAVFSATKDELSQDRIKEIAEFLPGKIRDMWETA